MSKTNDISILVNALHCIIGYYTAQKDQQYESAHYQKLLPVLITLLIKIITFEREITRKHVNYVFDFCQRLRIHVPEQYYDATYADVMLCTCVLDAICHGTSKKLTTQELNECLLYSSVIVNKNTNNTMVHVLFAEGLEYSVERSVVFETKNTRQYTQVFGIDDLSKIEVCVL